MGYSDRCDISVLKGQTLKSIVNQNDEQIIFETEEGNTYQMYHFQDCCESVMIEDINGDLQDLVGFPLLEVEERTSEENPVGTLVHEEYQDSFTWTFYVLRTVKASVTIRWYGESNGYYGESVDFEKVNAN